MINLKQILLDFVFLGFGFGMLFFTVVQLFLNQKLKNVIEKGIQTAIEIVKISGLLYLLYLIVVEIFVYTDYEHSMLQRLEGEYWWSLFIIVLLIPFFTQLYWFRNIKKWKIMRLIIALCVLYSALLLNGDLVDIHVNIARGFGNVPNTYYYLKFFKNTSIFILFISALTYLSKKLNPKNNDL